MKRTQHQFRIGVVGSGFIARGLIFALQHYPQLSLSGVVTRRDPRSVTELGISAKKITNSVDVLIKSSDLIVECTGDVIHGTEMIERILDAGLPVVTMNSELQLVTGTALSKKGLLVEAEGDQPGSLAALDAEVRLMGFNPIVYGNVKRFLNTNPTPDEMHYWSKRQGISFNQVTAFTDGTKVQIEQALVANGLGATITQRNLSGVQCSNLEDGARQLALLAERTGGPISDYILCPTGPAGVFIVATHEAEQRSYLEYLKLGEGPHYVITQPYHLCHLEIPKTIAKILNGDQTYRFNNGKQPTIQVAAVAKRRLDAGMFIQRGIGSFELRGEAITIADNPNCVPIGLMDGTTLVRDLPEGSTITYDDVLLPKTRALELWMETLRETATKTWSPKQLRLTSKSIKPRQLVEPAQQPTVTVGIPTYYGAPSILKTVESIMASERVDPFRLIVNVDGNPLKPDIHKKLEELGAEVIFSKVRGGQTARIKQMIELCTSDILILTQDDVLFEPTALSQLLTAFQENPAATMVGAHIRPFKAQSAFESVIEVGVRISNTIGASWNQSDNYLLAIGRCLAFRTPFIKQFSIPDTIVNSDAFLYFENKRCGGTFEYASNAVVYNKSPQRLQEHLKQSKRFQGSQEELENLVQLDLRSEYRKPLSAVAAAFLREALRHPLLTAGYAGVFLYSKFANVPQAPTPRPFWETDASTKR